MIRSKKITQSARGEDCTVCILGTCNYNTETTVAAHVSDGTGGMARKASDTSICFACSACHDVIDGRVYSEEFATRKHWYLLRAIQRTIARLFEMGVVKVA